MRRAFEKIKAGLLEAIGVAKGEAEPHRVWLVDRSGAVIKPERKIVLKAKPK